MGMNTAQPSIMSQLNGDCCTAQGITCDSKARVTEISYSNLSPKLAGTMNGTLLPPLLTSIWLSGNQLNGNVPQTWPPNITTIYIGYNFFTGNIPQTWPSSMEGIYLQNNQLTGNIPNTWPSGLKILDLSTNPLNCMSPGPWPTGLQELHLNGLSCTGSIGPFPSSLQVLYLGWSRDAPGTYNKFSGTLSFKQSLTELGIAYNLFTNLFISNASSFTSCDISYNPLLGNPNIVNLTMCTQTGLYSPSLLPNTLPTSLKLSTFIKSTSIQKTSSVVQTYSSSLAQSKLGITSFSLSNAEITTRYSTGLATLSIVSQIASSEFKSVVKRSVNLHSRSDLTTFSSNLHAVRTHSALESNFMTSQTGINYLFKPTPVAVGMNVWSFIRMGIKLIIDALIIGGVVVKTPFKRALKFKNNRKVEYTEN